MKPYCLLLFFAAVLILLIENVYAIGISPGRTTIDISQGTEKSFSVEISNSEAKDMKVLLLVKGELKDFISLSEKELAFSPSESEKEVSVKVNLPDDILSKYGKHVAEVVAIEAPENKVSDETIVGVSMSVVSEIVVNVPYPDEFIEIDLDVVSGGVDEISRFYVSLSNMGEKLVNNIDLKLDILDSDGEVVTQLKKEKVDLAALERKEIGFEWLADVLAGTYKARATARYGNRDAVVEKEFSIGGEAVELILVYVKDFQLGSIAKFNAVVENKGTKEYSTVYFDMIILDEQAGIMDEVKSPTDSLSSGERKEFTGYWDTQGVKSGIYDSRFTLYYGEKKLEKRFKIKVSDNSIEIIGATGMAIASVEPGYNLVNILIAVIVVLFIAVVVLGIIVTKRRKKKKIERGVRIVK